MSMIGNKLMSMAGLDKNELKIINSAHVALLLIISLKILQYSQLLTCQVAISVQ